jgi:hypothetical protein
MNYLSKAVGIAIGAGIVVIGAGNAHADTFYACFKNTTQKVRPSSILLNASPACKATETLRTWNEQGPQGEQGPSGVQNCTVEEFPGTNQANTFSVLNSTCSGGATAMSASAIWHTPFDAADNGPFYFYPRGGGTVTTIPWNHTGAVADYRVFQVCCH